MVDYSKWDHVDGASSDEDSAEARRPTITRLDKPSRVTIMSASEQNKPTAQPKLETTQDANDYSKWDTLQNSDDDDDGSGSDDDAEGQLRSHAECDGSDELESSELDRLHAALADEQGAAACDKLVSVASPATDEPGAAACDKIVSVASPANPSQRLAALTAKWSRNGAACARYMWSQSELEVELSIFLPPGTLARNLEVDICQPAHPARQRLRALTRSVGDAVFDEALAYAVLSPEDASDLSWEVCDFEAEGGRRVLRVTLTKQVIQGVRIWWTRAFDGEADIDPLQIPDRRRASAAKSHQAVWAAAQEEFRKRVSSQRKALELDPGE